MTAAADLLDYARQTAARAREDLRRMHRAGEMPPSTPPELLAALKGENNLLSDDKTVLCWLLLEYRRLAIGYRMMIDDWGRLLALVAPVVPTSDAAATYTLEDLVSCLVRNADLVRLAAHPAEPGEGR